MAKKKPEGAAPIKARVLAHAHIDGVLHAPDTVVSVSPGTLKELEAQGVIDSDEDAVAYAESLVPKDEAAQA